jgi:aldose 1-epimerase
MRKYFHSIFLPALLVVFITGCCSRETQKQSSMNGTRTASIAKENWGKADDKDVFLFTMTNINGIVVKITNYGGIITSIVVPDSKGRSGDIVLGYDSLEGYLKATPYFGAIVGRYANRIARGTFTLGNTTYKLAVNNGKNSLHGGIKGFDKVVWDAKIETGSQFVRLILSYKSPDGEEGYPGNLDVTVTYTLTDGNMLFTQIEASTDKPTPVNLCNHTYFNLREADTSILGHLLQIKADRYTVVDDELIPTGELRPVEGTPMDFRSPHKIGERIDQVKGGYDHNYVKSRKVYDSNSVDAIIEDPVTGRVVAISTTQPGIQFYSGNFLDGTITGKGGKVYKQHYGLCLETQHFPDSPNHPDFPTTILKPGERFREVTAYKFGVTTAGKE